MPSFWAEAWERPGHATFGRVIDDLPSPSYGLHDGINATGDGNMSLPDTYDRLDELLYIDHLTPANCVSTLIRYFSDVDPTTPFFEWVPDSLVPTADKTDPTLEMTGQSIKSILAYARTEAFDWDGTDAFVSRDPDWIYGGNDSTQNGGLEDSPLGITNPGFEDGTREPWWPGAVEGYSANAQVQTVIKDTGTYALEVDPLILEGGTTTRFKVIPSKTYTITARIRGVLGVNYQMGAAGPQGSTTVAPAAIVDLGTWSVHSRGVFEAQLPFVGTGAFATQTLVFTTAPNQTQVGLSVREGPPFNGGNFYVDVVTVAGYGIGTDPWEPTDSTLVTVFQASSTQAFAGTWSLQTTAAASHGVFQSFKGILPGVTYTASIAIGHASAASEWALEIRDLSDRLIGQTSATIGTGAWTELEVTFRVPDFLPGANGEILVAAINYDTVARSAFVDELIFFRGLPVTTIGAILGDLYADATADHSTVRIVWEDEANPGTAYLLPDFTDSVDSAGAPWAHGDVSVRIWMRMSMFQVMGQFASDKGYEWRIVPDDVENGIWSWQVYNPGTMKVDYTTAQSPAIQGGSRDTRREVRRRMPSGTELLVEGLDRLTARDQDPTLVAALGRIEGSRLDRELPAMDAVIIAAAEDASDALYAGLTWGYTLAEPDEVPLIHYQLGDLLMIHDPPEVSDEGRFADVTGSISPAAAEWRVEFFPANLLGS